MRVPKTWLPSMSKRVLDVLLTEELIDAGIDKAKVLEAIEGIIAEELSVEDRLNDEVRGILRKFEPEIEKGRLDYRKLFEITKQKLVKERNLVL